MAMTRDGLELQGHPRVRTRSCPICDTPNSSTPPGRYGRTPWDIVDCRGCGFPHLRTVPVSEELVANLSWERTYAAEQQRRRQESPVLTWVDLKTRWRLRLLPQTEPVDLVNRSASPGPVLDLGCGSGEQLARLGPQFVPYGVEISAFLVAAARAIVAGRGGSVVPAAARDGLALFDDDFFTAATLRSYLEHEADAREVLLLLRRKLRPGGFAVVKVPNYGSINRRVMGRRWCGFRLPDHVNYFSRASLARLGAASGLSTHFPFWLSLPTDDNIVAILTKPGTPGSGGVR
jgi:SAM-dependent methyltransferase